MARASVSEGNMSHLVWAIRMTASLTPGACQTYLPEPVMSRNRGRIRPRFRVGFEAAAGTPDGDSRPRLATLDRAMRRQSQCDCHGRPAGRWAPDGPRSGTTPTV